MHSQTLLSIRIARTVTASAFAMLLGSLVACGSDSSSPTGSSAVVPASLTALSGDGQSGIVGSALAQSLVVKVTSATGAIVTGATVNFTVTSGSATLSPSESVTDTAGTARTQLTPGSSVGTVVVRAAVAGTSLVTTFTVTSVAATTTGTSCSAPLSLALGAVTAVSGTSICISGGTSGSEYALVPFNSSTTASTRATFTVQPTGISTVTATLASATSVGWLDDSGVRASLNGRETFELGLRSRERSAIKPRIAGARSWFASRGAGTGGARFNVIPGTVAVGSLVSLNSNANDACTKPNMRAGRVMAVGRKALVVADTLNPSSGFTQADYTSIATTFDDVVDAIDTKAFGEPSDIDGNGHVILYFTSAVNALTPKNASYYIGGFFYGRDLLPTTSTTTVDACASSNVAEMFYLLVPDPNGAINGNTFSKTFVSDATISTVAHEYQHLINASRRLYVNTSATDFEETWLDEGLAHMAEELVFYGRSGLSSLTDIDATLLRSNSTYRTAFNNDGIANFGRLQSFLANPSVNSPYAANDSLATRGATWSFLRYAIDQGMPSQETVLYQLVNSTTTGLANLRAVFGSDLTGLFRDWATSLVTDDVSGVATRYQFKSWNLRSVLGALTTAGTYPLTTQSLTSGTSKSVNIGGGGAAYLRFGVAANGTASMAVTASSGLQTTLVRLK